MRQLNLSPFPLGWKVTARQPPQMAATFVVRAGFSIAPGESPAPLRIDLEVPDESLDARVEQARCLMGQGPLRAEAFSDDDDERLGGPTYPGDFADFKPAADVILRGTCYPRDGHKVKECRVGFHVGGWGKELRVMGPRAWVNSVIGGEKTQPLLFDKMPLDYEHAFGGQEYARNPVGMGYRSDKLPCIEPIGGHNYNQQSDDETIIEPAGFAPINMQWPQRASKRGMQYDEVWKQTRSPFYAVDFDWSFFQAAPRDQQLPKYLIGDEPLRFVNMHPEVHNFRTQLPGIRMRVFVMNHEKVIREVLMNLDTLFVDLDEGKLFLTWRGLTPAERVDLSDLEFVLAVNEPLNDAKPRYQYEEQLKAFAADPIGLAGVFPDDFDPYADPLDSLELPPESDGRHPLSQMLAAAPKVGTNSTDMSEVNEGLQRSFDKLDAPGKRALRKSLAQGLSNARKGSASGGVSLTGGKPRLALSQLLKPLTSRLASLKADGVASPELAKLEEALSDPQLQQVDPNYQAPGDKPKPVAEPGPGADLSGQDLSGRDLSRWDLSGANLEAANLSEANLQGADLRGANLRYASLYRAKLDGAFLNEADLSYAAIAHASAANADFSDATMEMANFRVVDLTAAKLNGARGQMPSFTRCNFSDALLHNVSFEQVGMNECNLAGADFSGATMLRGLLRECAGEAANFNGAELSHTSFMGSVLNRAMFSRTTGSNVIFLKAQLDDAHFEFACLPEAKFMDVSAIRAGFDAADLRFARFDRAILRLAVMSRCNLFSADMRQTVLASVSFKDASLFDAKLIEAAGNGIDWSGANVAQIHVERSELVMP